MKKLLHKQKGVGKCDEGKANLPGRMGKKLIADRSALFQYCTHECFSMTVIEKGICDRIILYFEE